MRGVYREPALCSFALCSREAEFFTVAGKALGAMPEPQQRAFADRLCPARILAHERPQHFPVPALRMAYIEHRMQRKIVPLLCGNAQPAQCAIDVAGACGRGHLDHPERANGMKCVSTMPRQGYHHVAERERLWHHAFRRGMHVE